MEYEGEYLYNKKWNGKGHDEDGNIIYELNNGNGKGKEYDGDQLKFEGEYLNGKRNGNGKEYGLNNNLLYEGEFLNGKRNGKGKEYYSNGKLKIKGEYLNSNIWNGKGYNQNGNMELMVNYYMKENF